MALKTLPASARIGLTKAVQDELKGNHVLTPDAVSRLGPVFDAYHVDTSDLGPVLRNIVDTLGPGNQIAPDAMKLLVAASTFQLGTGASDPVQLALDLEKLLNAGWSAGTPDVNVMMRESYGANQTIDRLTASKPVELRVFFGKEFGQAKEQETLNVTSLGQLRDLVARGLAFNFPTT